MKSTTIRKKFLDYFVSQEHVVVPSSSLVPDNDPSVLLTTAGMQQFKPYFLGERNPIEHLGSRRLTSVQRCFRTSDIDTVGDASHLTFFEMLGNFSIGDCSKAGAIRMAWECLTKTFRLSRSSLWVTIFAGDERTVKDFEAAKLWLEFIPKERVTEFGREENWWGPAGISGPCGPSSEIHVDRRGSPCERGDDCRPNCPCGRFLEVWNLVFMEYYQDEAGMLKILPMKNVDTGMGLERLAMVLQDKPTVFDTDLFLPITSAIKEEPSFGVGDTDDERNRKLRLIADHLKASSFLVADGVRFSNKDRGYVLRRVFRRALDQLVHPLTSYVTIVNAALDLYGPTYDILEHERSTIHQVMAEEAEEFLKRIGKTLHVVSKKTRGVAPATAPTDSHRRELSPEEAFQLYTTHGISLSRLQREGYQFDEEAVKKKIEHHRQTSRAGAQSKFGGHGIGYMLDATKYKPDDVVKVTRLHTATHLLHQALRATLGPHVRQSGSDISPERLRFDFTHPTKVTPEELHQIEQLVNQQIERNLPVHVEEKPLDEALSSGVLSFFREKYPARVKVYSIGDFSREICGGPHVHATSEVGRFKILSERSSAAGIRRIKATVEP